MDTLLWHHLSASPNAREFEGFWSVYRNWVTFATVFLVPVGIQIFRHGWRSVVNFDETLANGFIGLVASLAGTYTFAIWKGAESLDAGLRSELSERDQKIISQEQTIQKFSEKPKRSPVEEHHYATAKIALNRLGANGSALLRHLNLHGTLTFNQFAPPLPVGLSPEAAREILNRCVGEQLVTIRQNPNRVSWDYVYEIAPGMKAALDELLYYPRR